MPLSSSASPASPAPTTGAGLMAPSVRCAVFVALVTGLAYPLCTTGVAQLLLPAQASGSLMTHNNTVIGSRLIGQNFTQAQYFHPRPSSTADAPYNAAASSGSNLGPTNAALVHSVAQRVAAYRASNGLAANAAVPVDAVTASASGLDPDISPANAQLQAPRVAQARGIPISTVQALIAQHSQGRWLGLLGEPRVHVLPLNVALDAISTQKSGAAHGQ